MPVRLAVDTGSEASALYHRSAERIGLKIVRPPVGRQPKRGKIATIMTEECVLSLGQQALKTHFLILEQPTGVKLEGDGLIGWGNLATSMIMIEGGTRRLILDAIPDDLNEWYTSAVKTDTGVLAIEVPWAKGAAQPSTGALYLDTGSQYGVEVRPAQWRAWRSANHKAPLTLTAYMTPADNLIVALESWADPVGLGGILLHNVPIKQCAPSQELLKDYRATLGLAALSPLDIVIDGDNAKAYVRSHDRPIEPYRHNRLGAVFVPKDLQSPDLVGQVIRGGPAHEAGLRSGDILLKIDTLNVTRWQTDPDVLPLSRFWKRPAGTELNLTVRRAGEVIEASMVLRDILGSPPIAAPR